MLRTISTFFLVALLGACQSSVTSSSTLHGRVLDDSGAPVADATVALHQTAGVALLTTRSNASGEYSFAVVAAGQYLVDASTRELSTNKPAVVVFRGDDQRQLDITVSVSAVKAQVSVTAADSPQSVDQISKALDVVSVPEAEQRGLFTAPDALRFTPGLLVTTRGGPGSYTEIETRGLPVQDTAVLLDGSPLRDPTSPEDEASAFLSQLFLVDSDRIEILRGSGSSLYGTNAGSGTLNIITSPGGGAFHGDVDVQGGGLGLFEGVAHAADGVRSNRLTYSAGLAHLDETEGVDQVSAARDWSAQGGAQYAITPTMHASVDVFGTTGYAQPTETPSALSDTPGIITAIPIPYSQLKLANEGLAYQTGNATFLPSLGDPDAGIYSHFLNSLYRFDQEVTPHFSYRVNYSLLTTDRDNTDGPAGVVTPNYFPPTFNTSDRYDGRVDTLDASASYLAGSHEIVSAGYEFAREHYDNVSTDQNPDLSARVYNRTKAEQDFQSAFAQDEIRMLHNRLQILLSGRFTGVNLYQPSFVGGSSPYAGIALPHPENAYTGDVSTSYFVGATGTKVRAHVGNSFRMPSLYERFGGYFYGGAYNALGDPGLSPERSVSGDFGFDQYLLGERVRVSGTYFYSRLQQVVSAEYFPSGYVDPYGRTYGYYNTGGGMARGVEVSAQIRPDRHTYINASYTYTNARDETSQYYTGTAVDPLQTPRILPNDFKVVATRQFGKRVDTAMDFDGGSSYLFPLFGYAYVATPFRFDGPRQLGLSAGYTMPAGEHTSLRFYTRVSNVLGQDFYQDGFRTPGRWAVGGIHLFF